MLREKLEAEFKASYKNLRKRASQVKWDTLCPELELREKVKGRKLNIIEDLWEADMGKALRWTFSLLAAFGVPSIDGLGPFGTGFHSLNEWADLDNMRLKCQALTVFLQNL